MISFIWDSPSGSVPIAGLGDSLPIAPASFAVSAICRSPMIPSASYRGLFVQMAGFALRNHAVSKRGCMVFPKRVLVSTFYVIPRSSPSK